MENFRSMVAIVDCTLDTDRKRHIAGGILFSIAILFTGLAITVMTIKKAEEQDEQE